MEELAVCLQHIKGLTLVTANNPGGEDNDERRYWRSDSSGSYEL